MKYKFDCNCSFSIAKEIPKYKQPCLSFNYYQDFNENCQAVWKTFENGLTLGVFQLESNLGKKYCKELKPENIEHLSALTAILRPGCLGNTDENGVSVTLKYCNRKNKKESIEYPIPALEPILKDTYGLLIYQESSIRLGIEIAGFNQGDADYYLRKAIGIKDAKLLFSAEEKFIEGCKQVGKVSEEEAKTIFSWIKASARYAFNKCVTLDTLTETKFGFKTLEELSIGDKIKAPNLETNQDEFVEVLDKIECGEQDVYEITLESGKQIKCTMEHKFVCEDKIVRTLREIIDNNHSILCEDD